MAAHTPNGAVTSAVEFSAAELAGPKKMLLTECAVIIEDAGNAVDISGDRFSFGVVALVASPSASTLAASETLAIAVEDSVAANLNALCPQASPWLVRVFDAETWRSIKGHH